MKTRLITFGFEIEGEFLPAIKNYAGRLFEIGKDGSLRKDKETPKSHELLELRSKVMKTNTKGLTDAKRIMDYCKLYAAYRPNESSGFHIHLGFNPKVPAEIKFVDTIPRTDSGKLKRKETFHSSHATPSY